MIDLGYDDEVEGDGTYILTWGMMMRWKVSPVRLEIPLVTSKVNESAVWLEVDCT